MFREGCAVGRGGGGGNKTTKRVKYGKSEVPETSTHKLKYSAMQYQISVLGHKSVDLSFFLDLIFSQSHFMFSYQKHIFKYYFTYQ